jgi:hypothetical protein
MKVLITLNQLLMKYNEYSIEEWCSKLDKEPRRTALDSAEDFINLYLNKDRIDSDESMSEKFKEHPLISIMLSRIKFIHNYEVTNSGIIFMSMLVNSPGECVMLVNYLQYKSVELDISKFDMDNLVEIFPTGGWSEEIKSKYWELQKLPENLRSDYSDNMLDYPSRFGKSLL